MLRIVADEKIPFLRDVLEPFSQVTYLPHTLINRELVTKADALLIRSRTKCDKSLLEGTAVKFIATATIGFDHLDIEFCKSRNIHWVNAPGCNSSSVQQYVIASLLMFAQKDDFSLGEKTLGIIGAGNVGSKVQAAANFLGIKVKLNDPPRARREGNAGFTSLDEILETSDIITLHVPLNLEGEDKTFQLFNENLFRRVKPGTWLINTSRGEVAETNALGQALATGKLKGAVLDVWENEPGINLDLMRRVFISTPHIAGYSTDGKANGTAQVVRALGEFYGLPLHDFYPRPIPAPVSPEIIIEGTGKSDFQILSQAVLHTYPIMQDHNRLQGSPETFEQQRGHYPVRREFPAYNIRLINGRPEAIEILSKLGFRVMSN
jgi:erythronate-4-phosphate dehydrogenase